MTLSFVGHARSGLDRNLCAQAREGVGVADVGARLGTTTGATASTALATATATTATLTAESITAAATAATALAAEFTATTLTTSTAATATASTEVVAGSRLEQAVAIELDEVLLLALTVALGLAAGSGNEVLILGAFNGLALGELGRAALVGLADVLRNSELLLRELGKVLLVRLALLLGLLLDSGVNIGSGVFGNGVLLVLLGDGLALGLVGELGVAVVTSPSVCDLLLVLTAYD